MKNISDRLAQKAYNPVRVLTSSFRRLPNFIIIGSQKCGTTSLYNYLIQHPNILTTSKKEIHFFDLNYSKGTNWYKSHFPLNPSGKRAKINNCITGEATPYYIFHPQVPEKMYKTLPSIKLIALLREPIARTYSHYNHEVRKGREKISFEETIEKEMLVIDSLLKKREFLLPTPYMNSLYCRTYLSRSLYVYQLSKWLKYYKRDQLLLIKSEDFYQSPSSVLNKVFNFLEVPEIELPEYRKYNSNTYKNISNSIKNKLDMFFKPHNKLLRDQFGNSFFW